MVAFALLLSLSAAPTMPKLVSMQWTTSHVDAELADFYSETLARSLRTHGISVTTPKDIQAALGFERSKQLLGCGEDGSCIAELANAMGCDARLLVSVAKLDATLTAIIKVVSANTGAVLAEVTAESKTERGFVVELESAARDIAQRLTPAEAPKPARAYAWLPLTVGGVLLVGGAVSIAGAYVESAAIDARPAQTRLTDGLSVNDASWGKVLQTGGWVASGVGLAAIATGLVLLFFPETRVAPTVTLAPDGARLGLSVVLP